MRFKLMSKSTLGKTLFFNIQENWKTIDHLKKAYFFPLTLLKLSTKQCLSNEIKDRAQNVSLNLYMKVHNLHKKLFKEYQVLIKSYMKRNSIISRIFILFITSQFKFVNARCFKESAINFLPTGVTPHTHFFFMILALHCINISIVKQKIL